MFSRGGFKLGFCAEIKGDQSFGYTQNSKFKVGIGLQQILEVGIKRFKVRFRVGLGLGLE